MLYRTAGDCRHIYNFGLEENNKQYAKFKEDPEHEEYPDIYWMDALLTEHRNDPAFAWLHDTCAHSQQRAMSDVITAIELYKQHKTGRPTKKKRGKKDSFYVPSGYTEGRVVDGKFKCPKVGWIPMAEMPRYDAPIVSFTVSRRGNNWYLTMRFSFTTAPKPVCENRSSIVGIDVGLRTAATCNDGVTFNLPDISQLEKRVEMLQVKMRRSLRKNNGRKTKRYNKILRRYRDLIQHMLNMRTDAINKFTTAIAKNHGIVRVETINIREMAKAAPSRCVRHSYAYSVMGEIIRQLSYKAYRFERVPRFLATTQTCSACGNKQKLTLRQRTYKCPNCGLVIDRDLNAAINIAQYQGEVTPVENADTSGSIAKRSRPTRGGRCVDRT